MTSKEGIPAASHVETDEASVQVTVLESSDLFNMLHHVISPSGVEALSWRHRDGQVSAGHLIKAASHCRPDPVRVSYKRQKSRFFFFNYEISQLKQNKQKASLDIFKALYKSKQNIHGQRPLGAIFISVPRAFLLFSVF